MQSLAPSLCKLWVHGITPAGRPESLEPFAQRAALISPLARSSELVLQGVFMQCVRGQSLGSSAAGHAAQVTPSGLLVFTVGMDGMQAEC